MSGIGNAPSSFCYRQLAATNDVNPNVASDHGCKLKGMQLTNAKAAIIYFKLYNYTGSAPVVGDVPVKTIAIPASSTKEYNFGDGFSFPKGLSYRVTLAAADGDTTVLLANDFICLNLDMSV